MLGHRGPIENSIEDAKSPENAGPGRVGGNGDILKKISMLFNNIANM